MHLCISIEDCLKYLCSIFVGFLTNLWKNCNWNQWKGEYSRCINCHIITFHLEKIYRNEIFLIGDFCWGIYTSFLYLEVTQNHQYLTQTFNVIICILLYCLNCKIHIDFLLTRHFRGGIILWNEHHLNHVVFRNIE